MFKPSLLARSELDRLLQSIRHQGFELIGPTIRDGAIVLDEIQTSADLPIGWTDEQSPGRYRLKRRSDAAVFGYVVGPHSWKRWLYPPRQRLWQLTREGASIEVRNEPIEAPQRAFLGVRPCELAAIEVQDRVLRDGRYVDVRYAARRAHALLIAVNCGEARSTCFCTSTGTGPRVGGGFDLALTELLDGVRHDFLVEVGTSRGAAIVADLPLRPAMAADAAAAAAATQRAEHGITRRMTTSGLRGLLRDAAESPHWDAVAQRCLTCGNCTLVCPTCFCCEVRDTLDVAGTTTERFREWDSCFNGEFTYVAGGSVRAAPAARYRQWLTHKLASWQDQFDCIGCVGCGRCITWCPVGIDLTEEVAALQVAAHDLPATATEVAP